MIEAHDGGAVMAVLREQTETKFAERLHLTDIGCMEWQGAKTNAGYGTLRIGARAFNRHFVAHRFAWELFVGRMPDGLELDHLCCNRACVNPDHLELVTRRENLLRGETPPGKNARKTHCYRGHPLSGSNLYVRTDGGRECVACRRFRRAKEEEDL